MLRIVPVFFAIAAVAACAPVNAPVKPFDEAPFRPTEAAYIHKPGPIRIEGEAFIINKNGKPMYAAGELIRLVPATNYAKKRFASLYRGKNFLPAAAIPKTSPDPEYAKYTRTTVASANGKFSFDNVGPGEYFVTAQKIHRPPGSFAAFGGAMYTSVAIAGNERWPVRIVVAGK